MVSVSSLTAGEPCGNGPLCREACESKRVYCKDASLVTTRQSTNAFCFQSPRHQTAVPILENLVVRMRLGLPKVSVHVDFGILFEPDPGVKVTGRC